MPIGTGIIYNAGDLILSTVSGSGTAFLETKIAAATSSIVYFDSNARINSASLNSITVGTASYVSGSTSIITNLTASNISVSGTGSFGIVGIGTSSPAAKLDVSANAVDIAIFRSSGGLANDKRLTITSGGEKVIFNVSDNSNTAVARAYEFQNAGTASMTINVSGSVGIGTTSPSGKLHVVGNGLITSGSAVDLRIDVSGTGNASLTIDRQTSGAESKILLLDGGASQWGIAAKANSNNFVIRDADSTERFTILKSGGNVGIGTTSPGEKLTVSGSSYIIGVTGAVGTGTAYYLGDSSNRDLAITRVGAAAMAIGRYYPSAWAETIRFTADGNVGIGTTVPDDKLHVIGNIRINGGDILNWGGQAFIQTIGANDMFFRPNSTLRMILTAAGNLGLGNGFTSPAYLLDVSGSSRFGFTSTNTHQFTGSVSVVGSVTAASFTGSLSGSITSALTASYLTPTNSYTITNLTASNISASATGSFGIVGIGTNSPAYTLEVNGTQRTAGNFYLFNTVVNPATNFSNQRGVGFEASTGKLEVAASASTALAIGRFGSTGQILDFRYEGTQIGNFSLDTNDLTLATARHLILSPTGNVGIGTSSPDTKLHVRGYQVYLYNDLDNNNTYFYARNSGPGNVGVKLKNSDGEWTIIANDRLRFMDDDASLERLSILSDGNVGIGTTSPGTKLEVSGSIRGGSFPVLVTNTGEAWFGRGGDRTLGTYTLQLGGSSATGTRFEIVDRAWTKVIASISGEAPVDSFLINTSGNLGIGTGSPVAKLQVAGNISGSSFTSSISNAVGFLGTSSWAQNVVSASFATTAQTANALNTANSYTITNLTASNISASATGSFGYVGIGTNSPTQKLHIQNGYLLIDTNAAVGSGIWMPDTNGNPSLRIVTDQSDASNTSIINNWGANTNSGVMVGTVRSDGTAFQVRSGVTVTSGFANADGTTRFIVNGDGNVGIGTTAPAAKLEISGSSNSALLNIKSPISGAILFVSGSGAVGIGTSAVGAFTLQVSGSFGATTKSFIIEHPTKAGKKLMYGSLESPYHGIRLTGRDTLVNGKCKIQLPDYIYKLILHDSVNIQLTGIKCNKTLYIDDINVPENYFTIAYDKTVFESYKTYDFFWDFTAIRADVPELQTEM